MIAIPVVADWPVLFLPTQAGYAAGDWLKIAIPWWILVGVRGAQMLMARLATDTQADDPCSGSGWEGRVATRKFRSDIADQRYARVRTGVDRGRYGGSSTGDGEIPEKFGHTRLGGNGLGISAGQRQPADQEAARFR